MTTKKTPPALTPEEAAELAALEADQSDAKAEAAVARKRQHLQALKVAKAQPGVRGLDFEVVETTAGNFAIRRPVDIEVRAFTDDESKDDVVRLQEFLSGLRLFPSDDMSFRKALGDFPALGQILASTAMSLCGRRLEEEGK